MLYSLYASDSQGTLASPRSISGLAFLHAGPLLKAGP